MLLSATTTQHNMLRLTIWKRCGSKQSWHALKYYPDFCHEKLSKTVKNVTQGNHMHTEI